MNLGNKIKSVKIERIFVVTTFNGDIYRIPQEVLTNGKATQQQLLYMLEFDLNLDDATNDSFRYLG